MYMQVILGIDPGVAETGYGIVLVKEDGEPECLGYGSISTSSRTPHQDRLQWIYRELLKIIKKYKPHIMVVESLFFSRNTKSALSVGEARGVVMLAGSLCSLEIFEYTPLQVKECLAGYGRASKDDVKEMVQAELGLDIPPVPSHASDALALALSHIFLHG